MPATPADATYRRVLQAMRELVCEWSVDGVVTFANSAYTAFFGYEDEVAGRSVLDLIPSEAVPAMRTLLGRFAGGEVDEYSVERFYDDGRVVEWVDTLLRDDDGHPVSIVSVGRDVTARVRMEAELARRRDDALEQTRQRAEFVAIASHELRNPLHGMLGLAEILCEQPLDPDAAHLATQLHRQASGLRRIVDDLLEFNRLDAGGLTLSPRPCRVRTLVDAVADIARSRLPDHLTLSVHVADDVPTAVLVDGDRVQQILTNLVANAIKFTTEGGVSIRIATGGSGAIARGRGAELSSTILRCTVTDSGPGIAPADQVRIFEPFTQAGHRLGGVGLGLAIVRLLVERMNGHVTLTSAPALGSSFTVDIPAPVVDAPEPVVPAVAASAGRRVLVVEDDETNQLLALRQLELLGAQVTLAADGHEALDRLEHDRFDLVLMDFQMPRLDGPTTTRRLRERERRTGGHAYVVGVTASAMAADRELCIEAGMDEFLAKPVSLVDLRGLLARRFGDRPSPGPSVPSAPTSPGATTPTSPGATTAADTGTNVVTTTDTAAPVTLFDPSKLTAIAEEIGSTTPVRALVTRFLDELPGREAALDDAVAEHDRDDVRRVVHTLASVSRLVGALALASWCSVAEAHAVTGGIDHIADDLTGFHALCASTREAVDTGASELLDPAAR